MEKRNIGICILLSIITCGLYSWYWMYLMASDLIEYNGETEGEGPGVEILLGIFTCGIYFYYWYYKMGKRIYNAEIKANNISNDESLLYIILAVFGLRIISNAIIQSKINKL